MLILVTGSGLAYAQPDTTEVFEFEYFFDVDPGFGSATTISVGVPALDISTLETLTSSGLSTGFHVLGYRARNLARRPSFYDSVKSAIDTTVIGSLKPTNLIDPTLLASGMWGITETRLVFVDQSDAGGIINVDQVEYFFDEDPGVGSATLADPFSPNSTVSLTQALGSSVLSPGFHVLGMRARAVGGAWGTTEARLVFVDQSGGATISNVDQIEYYFDTDPGVGSGVLLNSFSPATSVSILESLNSASLSTGFHVLGMRARAEGGAWGTTETRLVFIDQSDAGSILEVDQIEYFFDVDPGVGSATLASTSFAPNDTISITESLSTNALSIGFHVLGLRPRAVGGAWGTTETRLVYVDPSQNIKEIDQLEYFFDVDPGVGMATPIMSFTSNDFISIVESLDASSLAEGFHQLGVRARTEGGSWGTTETKLIYVDNTGLIQNIVAYEYFFNADPGIGLGVNQTVATPTFELREKIQLDISSLGLGINTLSVRAQTENGNWGIAEIDTFQIVTIGPPTLQTANGDTLNTTTFNVEVTFQRGVTGFDETDVLVFGDASASSFTGDGAVFSFSVEANAEDDIQVYIPPAAALAADDANPTPASDTLYLRYDITAPIVTVDPLATANKSPEITGKVNELPVTVSVTVDGTTYNSVVVNEADSTWRLPAGEITPLATATYDVEASATDVAGNTGADESTDELDILFLVSLPAIDTTSTSFVARWEGGEDVANYQLDVSRTSDFSTFLSGFDNATVNGNSILVDDLDFATSYFYRVRVVNNSSEVSDNSNAVSVKTRVDAETIADSLALVQVFAAVAPQGYNWGGEARLREWDGVTLASDRTRVVEVDISSTQSSGDLPNPFSEAVINESGLSVLTSFNGRNNSLTGLLDFSATSVATLDVANNELTFEDLEPVVALGIASFTYSPQADPTFAPETDPDFIKEVPGAGLLGADGTARIVPVGTSYMLATELTSENNSYNWTREGTAIIDGDRFTISGPSLQINSIDSDNMGLFGMTVTNSNVPDLTLTLVPESVFATAEVTIELTDGTSPLDGSERFDAALLESVRREVGYDTLNSLDGVSPSFVFEDVILGSYLVGIDPDNETDFVPTYSGDAFEWIEAEVVEVTSNTNVSISMTGTPVEVQGPGSLAILVEEDFPNEEARIDARRRAKRRKCGLRRRRTGGRTGQEEIFDLFAYGETNDEGEFEFGFLPEGVYRFFIEYPGIPLDPNAEVQFEVGELGISDTEFRLEAFATDAGIEVSINRILGIILTYFKDLEVYPNPATELLNIQYRHLKSQDVTAELVDLSGKQKWTQDLQFGYNGKIIIDVSGFEEGMYLLRFYDRKSGGTNVVSYRVVVSPSK